MALPLTTLIPHSYIAVFDQTLEEVEEKIFLKK